MTMVAPPRLHTRQSANRDAFAGSIVEADTGRVRDPAPEAVVQGAAVEKTLFTVWIVGEQGDVDEVGGCGALAHPARPALP
jgi:hypothetical protein